MTARPTPPERPRRMKTAGLGASPEPLPRLDIQMEPGELSGELSALLNRYCAESVSGTPDFILAEFLLDSLKAFNAAVVKRADWRGESTELHGGEA